VKPHHCRCVLVELIPQHDGQTDGQSGVYLSLTTVAYAVVLICLVCWY